MKKDGLEFKQEDNKFRISTSQLLDEETFLKRIAGVAAQKENFLQQIDYFKSAIAKNEESIKATEMNITFASEDLEEAFKFLNENNRQDLVTKLNEMIDLAKERLKQNQQANQENMEA